MASLWLLCFAARIGLAAPAAVTAPPPELLAAQRVLERLMDAASTDAPISLVVRPFHGSPCPPLAADPVARSEAASASSMAPSTSVCLSGFELPPRLQQGFFVPFVVSLQRQADPESDPKRPSAAIDGRTILLNDIGLELVRQGSGSGTRPERVTAPTLPPEATCRIAQEFAAIQLGQPPQRAERFDRIHAQLAERLHKIADLAHGGRPVERLAEKILIFSSSTYYMWPWVRVIQNRNRGHWFNARMTESPHWQVLQRYAPTVATAIRELSGLSEGSSVFSYLYYIPTTISEVWNQFDGWFGVAAQEREEVIEEQQKQAQAEALRLLAAAGFDPRSCADVFHSASAAKPDSAVLEAYEQARRKVLDPRPAMPSRFLPSEQKLVIYPRSALSGNAGSDSGAQTAPPITTREKR